ncbi:MAG: two-component system response regulator [Herminiimonas sp.]|nr:two-component system response regulator [Herminiimonas sp.]MDB5853587.1 two-component system response regulator [Herminiimonas sp.]
MTSALQLPDRFGAESEPSQPGTVIDKPPSLLLVDDEPRLLASLHSLLDGFGYQIETAVGGAAAIEALSRNPVDIVLLDLNMPQVSGHDVMRFMKENAIDASVIVLSGDSDIEAAIGALRHGAWGFLRKPYQHEELLKTVTNALGKRRLEEENRAVSWQLEHSERLYRFLIDSSPDIIYTLDTSGRFTYINERVTDLLGYDRASLIGKPYSLLVHEDDLKRARHVFRERRVGQRESGNVEVRLKCNGEGAGERIFETSLRTISINSMAMPGTPERVAERLAEREQFGTYGIARDVTEERRAQELVSYQAYHDVLTDLPNRILLRDRLDVAIGQARRRGGEVAVMFVDLDRFKVVNDSLGHLRGDELLRQVADRLKQAIRKADTLARVGGDEFILLIPELSERAQAEVVASKFLRCLTDPFKVEGHTLHVSASIGIAVFPGDGESIDDLLRHADMAMYQVKASGKNAWHFYDNTVIDAAYGKIREEENLRRALKNRELEMYYQPQIDVNSGKIVSMEALMRWNDPERGVVAAGDFLPMVEEIGMMGPVNDWMMESVCRDLHDWNGDGHEGIQVAINLSPSCLDREDFYSKLRSQLDRFNIAPAQIEVEITENICIRNPQYAMDQLRKLCELGVKVAIDDFGTGYSSLAYLHRFPVHTIKIDRSFVNEIQNDNGYFPVVHAVISIARGLGLNLIAEGVETEKQSRYLALAGCDTMQGYLYFHPMAKQDLDLVLKGRRAAEALRA